MKRLHIFPNIRSQRGQSLVEVALFFPIFIIMLAGLVEVANILVTQNRVTSATRAATRFGADGGEDAGMNTVLLNAVTQTLQLNQEVWDVWVIRGTVNEEGNGIEADTWEFNHVYGISNTQEADTVDEEAIKQEVLDELQRDEFGNVQAGIASDLEFVGTFAIHDIDSILGLNAIPAFADITSVKDLTVMRVLGYSTQATDGCDAFPIAIHEGIRSVTPPGTGASPFPNDNEFQNPAPHATYSQFINHVDNIELVPSATSAGAQEGYVYRIWNGFGSGNFGWLRWNTGLLGNTNNATDMLTWPGNSRDYSDSGAEGQPVQGSGYDWTVYGYIEPGDPTDQQMHVGDWVAANTGVNNSTNVRTVLDDHIANRRTLRLLVWNEAADPGSNGRYHISRFGIFRLHGYSLQQGWILAEFIRWDESCGQAAQTP
jgi:hypothetical protein